jgi:CheY-like chemotaxis protein
MRIFVLDDDKNRLQIFRSKLINHTVITAMTASEAIHILSKDSFEYIFLDHDLGDRVFVPSGPGTGYEVAKWLAEHPEKQAPNIVIHSYNPVGAKAMSNVLPKAQVYPGAWSYLTTESFT